MWHHVTQPFNRTVRVRSSSLTKWKLQENGAVLLDLFFQANYAGLHLTSIRKFFRQEDEHYSGRDGP